MNDSYVIVGTPYADTRKLLPIYSYFECLLRITISRIGNYTRNAFQRCNVEPYIEGRWDVKLRYFSIEIKYNLKVEMRFVAQYHLIGHGLRYLRSLNLAAGGR